MTKEQSVELMTDKMAKFVAYVGKKLPDDVEAKLQELRKQETTPLATAIYDTMARNQKLAVDLNRPCCQDTGVLQFWVKCGVNFPLMGELEALLKEAVVRATFAAPLRHNSVETFDEVNTKRNVGKKLPDDVEAKLQELRKQETTPLATAIYDTMARNQKLAVDLNRPCCQDTGVLQFWVKCGVNFPLMGELEALLKESVVRATFAAPLRHNSVETFDEVNTKRNVGKGTPTVFWDIVPDDDHCEIYTYMAGGGCTLPGKAMVLMPGMGYEGVTKFVLDQMTSYGLNACPPLLVGVGVATSVETAALLSKKALMRPLGSHNPNPHAAEMEKLLEDGINSIGLGPQGMSGKNSVMGVHIENTARHPSTIGVAVNVGCWSHRRGHVVFDKDLNATVTTHSGVQL